MPDLLHLLKARFGYPGFRDGQEEVVRTATAGESCLVVMPTGAGKSLCYQLPALAREGTTLVVSPLIALMKDQVDALQRKGIQATCINSSLDAAERRERMQGLRAGRWRIVYVAPERFSPGFLASLEGVELSMLAVDEAHCVSQWGHDFRPDYLRLGAVRRALGELPTIACTATATPRVQDDIAQVLGLQDCRRFIRGFDRKNIALEVISCPYVSGKALRLADLVVPGPSLVYCATRKNVERVVRALRDRGVAAGMYHGGMDHEDRVRVQDAFMEGRIPVAVATNAFGMGVDKADIRCIVHHDMPGTVEAYYQEIGRAGRDGKPSRAVLLHHSSDRRIQEFFILMSNPPAEQVEAVRAELQRWMHASGETRLQFPVEELARVLPSDAGGERAAAACLRVLARQGWLRRLSPRDNAGQVTLTGVEASRLRGVAAQVFQALRTSLGGRPAVTQAMDPEHFGRRLGLERQQVAAALRSLHGKGLLRYVAPRRCGGVELLRPDAEFELDAEALNRQRQHELVKLDRMEDYVRAACRRHYLLSYFGERPPYTRCGTCDACRSGKLGPQAARSLSAEEETTVRMVLSCVGRMRGDYAPNMVARVLTGSQERVVLGMRFHRLSTYGLLSSWSVARVEAIIKELVRAGALERRYVTRAVGGRERSYGVVQLTDLGRRVMWQKAPDFQMAVPDNPCAVAKPAAAPLENSRFSKDLMSYLKDVRRQVARAADVPAYVVAPNRTLEELAAKRPVSREAMLQVHGMGDKRYKRYGKAFEDAIRAWGDA